MQRTLARMGQWALAGVLLGALLLTGCAPQQSTATILPPATRLVDQPQPATAALATPIPVVPSAEVPTSYPQPATPLASGPEPTGVSAYPVDQQQPLPQEDANAAWQVRVLHTNNVYGEIDPCG